MARTRIDGYEHTNRWERLRRDGNRLYVERGDWSKKVYFDGMQVGRTETTSVSGEADLCAHCARPVQLGNAVMLEGMVYHEDCALVVGEQVIRLQKLGLKNFDGTTIARILALKEKRNFERYGKLFGGVINFLNR